MLTVVVGVVALGFAGGALDRTLGTRVTVVVPIIVPVIVVVIIAVIIAVIISVVVSIVIIIPVIVVVSIIVPIVVPVIIIIIITMLRFIPILRDTSLTQRNQRRRLLPLANTLSLRRVTVMHRVAFVRDADYRAADLPAAVGDVVAVEGVG